MPLSLAIIRKPICVLGMVLLYLVSTAQSDTTSGKWKIGIQFFPSSCKVMVTKVDSSGYWGDVNENITGWAPSAAMQVNFLYKMNKRFSLGFGAGYQTTTEQRMLRKNLYRTVIRPYEIRHCIEIPLQIEWRASKRISVHGGVSYSYFFMNTMVINRYTESYNTEREWKDIIHFKDRNPNYRRHNVATFIDLSYDIINGKSCSWYAGSMLQYGLTQIVKNTPPKKHYVQIGLATGINFNMNK